MGEPVVCSLANIDETSTTDTNCYRNDEIMNPAAAVAMVFLLEVDNLVYLFLVSDAMKKHMEEVRIHYSKHQSASVVH